MKAQCLWRPPTVNSLFSVVYLWENWLLTSTPSFLPSFEERGGYVWWQSEPTTRHIGRAMDVANIHFSSRQRYMFYVRCYITMHIFVCLFLLEVPKDGTLFGQTCSLQSCCDFSLSQILFLAHISMAAPVERLLQGAAMSHLRRESGRLHTRGLVRKDQRAVPGDARFHL